MTQIVLIVEHQTSHSNFHYAQKTGRPLVMTYCRKRKAHVAKIPLDQWRKDNFRIARNLLDQMLPVPILFDIEEQPIFEEINQLATTQSEFPKMRKRRSANQERAEDHADE